MLASTILQNLILNEPYSRKTLPFIKQEYFKDPSDQLLFNLIDDYTQKYNCVPSKEALLIDLEAKDGINQEVYDAAQTKISEAEIDDKTNIEFLVEKTENYCKDQAIYNALVESIAIVDQKKDGATGLAVGTIPKLLEDALSVSFDTHVGHDFLEDVLSRYDFYHLKQQKIPFDIEYLNKVTKGGLPRKTLSVLLSSTTGGGKSLCMCHFASANLMDGLNVLYITMEMSEEMIARRIDANLLNFTMDELDAVPKDVFVKRSEAMKKKAKGKLIIKEYPTGAAHSGHFRHLINELKHKKNFIPDVIYIDYLNICSSSRVKMSGSMNSYTYVKTIAEELRALSIETNTAVVSATQGNRSAVNSSDIDLTNTSESIGLPATVDLMLAIITTEQLEELGWLMFKQLKNRHGPLDVHRRFVIGIDRDHMRLFNVSEDAQKSFQKSEGGNKPKQQQEDESVMDNSEFGRRDAGNQKKNFTGFN